MNILSLISRLKKLDITIDLVNDQLKLNAPKRTLTPEIINELKEKKQEIIEFLQRRRQKRIEYASISPSEKREYYLLSSVQKRLYILQQVEADNTSYNLSNALLLEEKIDLRKLTATFKQLVSRHESLRTSIEVINGNPVQKVHEWVNFEIEYFKLAPGDTENKNYKLQITNQKETDGHHLSLIIRQFIRPFDLNRAPLLRVGLITVDKAKYVLMVDMHHVITDGMSQTLLTDEFVSLYAGKVLPPLKLQYKDYARWRRSREVKENLKQQEGYWLWQFAGEIPILDLLTDFPRPARQSSAGSTVDFELNIRETAALNHMAQGERTTLFMVLLAIYNIFLSKLSSQVDIIVGTPTAGRRRVDLNRIIGMFVNTLALRNQPTGNKCFITFLKEVKENTLNAFENQDYPFEELVEKVEVQRDVSRNPLFDVSFALRDAFETPEDKLDREVEGLKFKVKPYHYENTTSKFDLTLFANLKDQLYLKLEYCAKLFKEETMGRFINYFKNIISSVVKNPGTKISEIDIITAVEKRQLLHEFNDTKAGYPENKTIHELFEAQVGKLPDSPALKYEDKHLCYGELNRECNRLARALRREGVKAETVVGIKVDRSIEMIVAILGALKAGGAYLPIDPDYPKDRVHKMLGDCQVSVLVTEINKSGNHFSRASDNLCFVKNGNSGGDCEPLAADNTISAGPIKALSEECDEDWININQPDDMAYIIFTSGSTGKPKGSIIEHKNVVRLMFNDGFPFDFNNSDVWTLFHSYCFDFSVWEMYGALLYGGKLMVLPKMVPRDSEKFLLLLKKENVTVLNQVPSAFYILSSEEVKVPTGELNLKYIIFGGEALNPVKLKEFKKKYPLTKFINMYGITETTVHVTYKEIEDNEIDFNLCGIGKPIPTLSTYVMDKNLKLQPLGVPGELLVGGKGVGRGYLNRPSLTGEKFVDHPYRPGERLYKSGDLVRLMNKGEMEYLGRIDQQVKIRGFRIELGEIENQLLDFAPVKEAVVIDNEDNSGDKRLTAFIVPDPEKAYPVRQLLKLKGQGEVSNHQLHELPNGLTLFYLNRNETDFMYREIFEDQSYLQHGIKLSEDAWIFDVGANIGVFSLFAHQICKNAKVYSFEPIPPVYEVLELNTSLYGMDIKLFPCGISSVGGEAVFTYYPHNTVLSGCFADTNQEMKTVKAFINNQQFMDNTKDNVSGDQVQELLEDRLSSRQFKCELKTLSQIIEADRIEKIDLLKIDVEKSEKDVLLGINERDWPKIEQIVIEVHNVDGRLDKIIDLLEGHGYRVSVDQDRLLKNTDLYNVFAMRPGENEVPGENEENNDRLKESRDPGIYCSPGRLKSDACNFLRARLPEYMIPSSFVLLEAIPLTSNNKIDRKSLPSMSIETVGIGGEYNTPTDEVEKKLVEIWSGILGIEKGLISIDSNFFELGGHSLKATAMVSKVHGTFNIKLPLAEIFKTPQIKGLAQYIKEVSKEKYTSPEAAEKKEYYPLASAQKRLYILQQMDGAGIAYNIPLALMSVGDIDKEKLADTFQHLLKRHESLRTSFHLLEEEPVQKVHQKVNFEIEYQNAGSKAPRAMHDASTTKNFIRPFDLSQAPLLRVGLIKVDKGKHILMLDIHHIISDGISMNVLMKDFMALYGGEELYALSIQYKDFSEWLNSKRMRQSIKKKEEYWLKQFEREILVLNLPINYPRPEVQCFEGSTIDFHLGKEKTKLLKELALEKGVTLYMLLLAVYSIFLSKICGQEDIVIGSVIECRRHTDLKHIMGMFANMLAIRSCPRGEKMFAEFLKEVKERTLAAFENQEYPFEDLVNKVALNRDSSRNPLFDVGFSFQDLGFSPHGGAEHTGEVHEIEMPGLKLRPYEIGRRISKVDLTLIGMNVGDDLFFTFEYCTKLFERMTIELMKNGFFALIDSILQNTRCRIKDLDYRTSFEKELITNRDVEFSF